jgi:hypothetical protein
MATASGAAVTLMLASSPRAIVRAGAGYDPPVERAPRARPGAAAAVLAFLLWGLFPLYWKRLGGVPALEVVAHRTAWGFLEVAAWVTRGRGCAAG